MPGNVSCVMQCGNVQQCESQGVVLCRAVPLQDLDSFPGSLLSGTAHRALFDSNDRRWGSVLTCNAAAASFAALEPPQGLGQQAGLAVSVWVKLPVGENAAMRQQSAGDAVPQGPGDSPGSWEGLGGDLMDFGGAGSGSEDAGADGFQYVVSLTQDGSTGSSRTNQVRLVEH
jgi:hypothetical protein